MLNQNPILRTKDTINPFRFAASIIRDAIKWKLKTQSKQSRQRLHKLRNIHEGQKAVIICNGPSLNNVDFSLLENVYTFGLNKINLLFDRVKFRPSCIVSINEHVLEQNQDYFNSSDIPLFLDYHSANKILFRDNVTFLHTVPIKTFARDCSESVNPGGTVTYVAMQLAFHMGFSEVGLIGCDHYFHDKGSVNTLVKSGAEDNNHFDKSYFSGGQAWQLPDIPQSEYSYQMARDNFQAFDRKIYNCTDGGFLEIYQRQDLKDFLNKT